MGNYSKNGIAQYWFAVNFCRNNFCIIHTKFFMRKTILLSIASLFLTIGAKAQMVLDTVSTGPGYANHTWYSLQTGSTVSASKTSWDIAFATSAIGMGSSIRVNAVIGTRLWVYPNDDTSGWATLDTAGIDGWPEFYNSDTSWLEGAFEDGTNYADWTDLGWGVYNMSTHFITGDSLFVIKLTDNSYRKIWIQTLASGTYNFKFSNLDNTGGISHSLSKSTYGGKNFGYYSLRTNTESNPEPANVNWDLLFTQYPTLFPGMGHYNVTGVLQNHGTEAVKAYPINNPATYDDYSAHEFSTEFNILGYNWKTYTGGTYVIEDSTVYFVKTRSEDIWKVVFTGFGGSANGDFYFKKEKISSTGINDMENKPFMNVYPNPCSTNACLVVDATGENNRVEIYNITGSMVYNTYINAAGLTQIQLPVETLEKGNYIVRFSNNKGSNTSKLIVQ